MREPKAFAYLNLQMHAPVDNGLQGSLDHHYICYYGKKEHSLLNSLCDKYGSDKGETRSHGHPYPWRSHSYADFVERHFAHCREYVKAVFECGLGTTNPDIPSNMGASGRPGASLRVWRDYFPNAAIFGVDIDRSILFEEDRINTFYCDQTDPSAIASLWSNLEGIEFDLMIDDGLHTFAAGLCLLENSLHKLKNGGLYIIEDVPVPTLLEFKNYLIPRAYDCDFINLYRSHAPLDDNSLVVIRKSSPR